MSNSDPYFEAVGALDLGKTKMPVCFDMPPETVAAGGNSGHILIEPAAVAVFRQHTPNEGTVKHPERKEDR